MTQTTTGYKNYSDGNTAGDQAFSATDSAGNPGKGAFYGGTPVVQPNGYVDTSPDGSSVAVYQVSLSPSAVSATTTAEQTFTVTGLATADLVVVNKPTAQTALGIVGYRVSSANTLGITYANTSTGSITPTASQTYTVVAFKGGMVKSVTWSPSAVAAYTSAEQQVTVSGARVGDLVMVNKPTAQTGLGIVNARVVSDGIVGVTFQNFTVASITPTASESYYFVHTPALSAVSGILQYGFQNVNGASIAATTQADVTTTVTGILATDVIAGVSKPSSQGAGIVGYRVPSADVITVQFMNISSGAVTPTTTEVLTASVVRRAPKGALKLYSAAVTPTAISASSSAEVTTTVTGLIASSSVWVAKPTATAGIGIVGARVSAADTLAITYQNSTAAAITPPSETYIVGNFQQVGPGAANSVIQNVMPASYQLVNLALGLQGQSLVDD